MIARRHVLSLPVALLSLACAVALVISGCGPSGPPRYKVSGKATCGGQAIPAGQIVFEPDASASNHGPLGLAVIKDGKYETLPEEGAVGGPQLVRILGYDGKPPPAWPGSPFGRPICDPYETKVDLPKEATTVDFDVPAKP